MRLTEDPEVRNVEEEEGIPPAHVYVWVLVVLPPAKILVLKCKSSCRGGKVDEDFFTQSDLTRPREKRSDTFLLIIFVSKDKGELYLKMLHRVSFNNSF